MIRRGFNGSYEGFKLIIIWRRIILNVHVFVVAIIQVCFDVVQIAHIVFKLSL